MLTRLYIHSHFAAGTITGSIGVASMRPYLTPEFLDKAGITTDDILTTNSGRSASIFHDLDAKEIARTERGIDQMYKVFRKRVADGRGWSDLPPEECEKKLNSVTGGRVFSGEQAKENGLVDELGGIDYAIHSAVQAGLMQRTQLIPEKVREVLNQLATPPEPQQVDVRVYPVEKTWLALVLGGDKEAFEESMVSLGRNAMSSVVGWFTAGDRLWEMEKALLEAGDKADQNVRASRGRMEADVRVSL